MFTEGLDESAINWVKKGSETEQRQTRSTFVEKLSADYPAARSPLPCSSNPRIPPHVLPPLKFHSSFLKPLSVVSLSVESDGESSDYCNDNADDTESVGSVPVETRRSQSDEDTFRRFMTRGIEEEMPSVDASKRFTDTPQKFTINRGVLNEDLKVGVPSFQLHEITQPPSAYGTPVGVLAEAWSMGNPSAPPFVDNGMFPDINVEESCDRLSRIPEHAHSAEKADNIRISTGSETGATGRNEEEASGNRELPASLGCENSVNNIPHYSASGPHAWQALVAYDACVRLCLNSWARGCTEAPEFLRDECLLLRHAFGLHELLLQPRGLKQKEAHKNSSEQVRSQVRREVGKIRLEVKKLRIIPRRKLKSTSSMRSLIYQVGAEYVRQVSSVVKHQINSFKLSSFSCPTEDSLQCMISLKSLAIDNEVDPSSFIILHPGSGEYHDFHPESQGDALLLQVQDSVKNVHGVATIPVSSLIESQNDRVRWWPIYRDEDECVGKLLLSVGSTFTNDEIITVKNGTIVETLAYDLLTEAAMRAQHFNARNLHIVGPWKWLMTEFADSYEVSDCYTKLRYLSYILNVATPTKDCLELVHEFLVPVLKSRNQKQLTRQEKSIFLECEIQVERLLVEVFQNYKCLDESSNTGLADMSRLVSENVAPALASAVQLYTLLHDILAQDAQTLLRSYLQTAAMKRCRFHMLETDELVASNSDVCIMDSEAISKAYMKMKNLCISLRKEIDIDIKIHNKHIFPSSIDLSTITSDVYSSELRKRLINFLSVWPPSSPMPHVNELLIAMADFERSLKLWNISPPQGGINARDTFHGYIMVWIQDIQLTVLELCKAEKVPWSGVVTKYSTSPFAEDIFERLTRMLNEYEVVISLWPEYTLILENAAANMERAIIKALERQYHDILEPLRDSIQKKIGKQVQKLARRQSTSQYSIQNQLGIFLNTMKRILDVLHCRIEEKLKSWATYMPKNEENKSTFGEQMNAVTVLLRTKYKNYIQAIVVKLSSNLQSNRNTRLQRLLEDTNEADGEPQIRERMQLLSTQLGDYISSLHEKFASQIFVAICRAFWDKMGQIVLRFLEGRKENRIWYTGSYHALGVLDDIFASQMQRLLGNALQEKELEPPRSITEARSILSRDNTNTNEASYVRL